MIVYHRMWRFIIYQVGIETSNEFEHFFVGQITIIGKVPPIKVIVIRTSVTGLSTIQTVKNMGTIVRPIRINLLARY